MADKWENDNAPRVELLERFVEFPIVRYKETHTSTITLVNSGPVVIRWMFIKKDVGPAATAVAASGSNTDLICKRWVKLEPALGILLSGQV